MKILKTGLAVKTFSLILAVLMVLSGCKAPDNNDGNKNEEKSKLNGVPISEYAIVYSNQDYDYSRRAAQYIKKEIQSRRERLSKNDRLYKYAEENNIKYFEDSSNESDEYLRNRIRHHVIPLLEEENPSLSSSITNFSNQLFDAFSYIRNKSIDYVKKHNNKIDINSFINLALIEKKDIINYICDSHGILSSDNKINDILDLIDSNRPNLVYDLNKEYQFIKSYDICYISKKEIKQTIHHEIYPNEKVTIDGYGEFCFNEYTYDLLNSISVSVNEPLPLVIRTRKNGDKLIIGDGHKKLKDFLIDKKVPLKERDKILLVENNNKEIIWVLGYYKKVCNEENSLKLTFKEKIR
jgi:tRNA(Ile)-lysidine synthetase-like protein